MDSHLYRVNSSLTRPFSSLLYDRGRQVPFRQPSRQHHVCLGEADALTPNLKFLVPNHSDQNFDRLPIRSMFLWLQAKGWFTSGPLLRTTFDRVQRKMRFPHLRVNLYVPIVVAVLRRAVILRQRPHYCLPVFFMLTSNHSSA